MASKVICGEALDQIKLEVLFYQKLLASLSLLEGVVVLDITSIDSMFLKLLHALSLKMSENSIVQVVGDSLDCIFHLNGVLNVHLPLLLAVLCRVERLKLLL